VSDRMFECVNHKLREKRLWASVDFVDNFDATRRKFLIQGSFIGNK